MAGQRISLHNPRGSLRWLTFIRPQAVCISISILTLSAFPSFAKPPKWSQDCPATPASDQVEAVNFVGFHAGTEDDPFPANAIVEAAASLPLDGGTVIISDGVWLVDSILTIANDNLRLIGQSQNARIHFAPNGKFYFHKENDASIANLQITNLTIDASVSQVSNPFHVRHCDDCHINENRVIGHPNGSIPALLLEGGNNYTISDNLFISTRAGGFQLQLNPLGISENGGSLVSGNEFDSTGALVIGLNNFVLENNFFHNKTLGNTIGALISPPGNGKSMNVTVRNNTIDALQGSWNGAILGGVPQDPALQGTIEGFILTGNVLRGTGAWLSPTSPICNADCEETSYIYDIEVSNNFLVSMWHQSRIDLRGGIDGMVESGIVRGNILMSMNGQQSDIVTDETTVDVTIEGNLGVDGYTSWND